MLSRVFESRPDDDREEDAKAIHNRHDCQLNTPVQPGLDILGREHEIFSGVMALAAVVGFCQFGPSSHDDSVIYVEEICRLVVLRYDPEAYHANNDCGDALDDVEPGSISVPYCGIT